MQICLMSIKTGQFIKLYKLICKIMQNNLFLFSLRATDVFGTQSNIYGELFYEKSEQLKVVNYFNKNAPP